MCETVLWAALTLGPCSLSSCRGVTVKLTCITPQQTRAHNEGYVSRPWKPKLTLNFATFFMQTRWFIGSDGMNEMVGTHSAWAEYGH